MKNLFNKVFSLLKGLKDICDPAYNGHPYLPRIDMETGFTFNIFRKKLIRS